MNIIVYRKSNQSLLGSFNFPADSDAPMYCLKAKFVAYPKSFGFGTL